MELRKIGHIYVRVSSSEQADTGNSIENQKSQCRDFCARNNIIVKDVYVDAGISGSKIKRPEFLRLQSAIENGEHIIAYAINRLSRCTKDFIAIVEWTESKNITLHTVKDPIDTKTAYGTFATMLNSTLSQLEANLTRERMAELNLRKLRRGETTKAPPFGYRSIKPSLGMPARLVPDVFEQEGITRMFNLRWQKEFKQTPYKDIAKKLNEEGFHPRRSKTFSVESIRQIMDREYEMRMRVHGTLTISKSLIQRYSDLYMPFIVPYAMMDKYIVRDSDGREMYNGQYEDSSVDVDRVYFFSDPAKSKIKIAEKAKKRKDIASSLDLHLMLYDKAKEDDLMKSHIADQELVKRRLVQDSESKEFRVLLEQVLISRKSLDSKFSSLRVTLNEDLKTAELKYKLYIEEKKAISKGYNEHEDLKAMELKLGLMQVRKRLSEI